MSTPTDHRKPVRIVAFNAKNVHILRTVNILAVAPVDPGHSIKEHLQLTAAQAQVQHQPTLMASGAPGAITSNLPTIFILGYTAPN